MNDPNNILNRLFLLRSSKVKGQLWGRFSKCSDLAQFNRNDHYNIVNRLNLLSRSAKVKGQLEVRFSKYSD